MGFAPMDRGQQQGHSNRAQHIDVTQAETYPTWGADTGRWPVPIDDADPVIDPDTPHPLEVTNGPNRQKATDGISLGPDDRAAAHRAYRLRVDQACAAPRDGATWDQALPGLRAGWEAHREQYPAREHDAPKTHADGSWSSGDRQLNSSQNTEASEAHGDVRAEGERDILPSLRRVEAADPGRRLAGLEHMIKGADRLKEKIAEQLRYHPDQAPAQAARDVPDAVRFTLEYSEAGYTTGVLADVDRLKGEGYVLLKLKNLWSKEQYKGINSQWLKQESGLRFEVQFHTQESREAKELTHEAYERLRDPLTSKAEETALEAYQRQVNALIRTPPDVSTIEDYPPEKRHA
jgi:hypothetical protein